MLKKDLRKTHLFSDTFRFIDHMCAISDHAEFDKNFKNIYTSEFRLKKEDRSIIKNLRLSARHSIFILFANHISTGKFRQIFTMHLQALTC